VLHKTATNHRSRFCNMLSYARCGSTATYWPGSSMRPKRCGVGRRIAVPCCCTRAGLTRGGQDGRSWLSRSACIVSQARRSLVAEAGGWDPASSVLRISSRTGRSTICEQCSSTRRQTPTTRMDCGSGIWATIWVGGLKRYPPPPAMIGTGRSSNLGTAPDTWSTMLWRSTGWRAARGVTAVIRTWGRVGSARRIHRRPLAQRFQST